MPKLVKQGARAGRKGPRQGVVGQRPAGRGLAVRGVVRTKLPKGVKEGRKRSKRSKVVKVVKCRCR